MPVLCASTRILKPFEDREQTGLKVETADELTIRAERLPHLQTASFSDQENRVTRHSHSNAGDQITQIS